MKIFKRRKPRIQPPSCDACGGEFRGQNVCCLILPDVLL